MAGKGISEVLYSYDIIYSAQSGNLLSSETEQLKAGILKMSVQTRNSLNCLLIKFQMSVMRKVGTLLIVGTTGAGALHYVPHLCDAVRYNGS